MRYKVRICSNVNHDKLMVARVKGGERGYGNKENAVECVSNDIVPSIQTMPNFVVIVEPI